MNVKLNFLTCYRCSLNLYPPRWGNLFNHIFKGSGCDQKDSDVAGSFKCLACPLVFSSLSALRLHLETQHTPQPWAAQPACPHCGVSYSR